MPDRRKPLFCHPLDLGTIATGNERTATPAAHLNRHKSAGLVWQSNGDTNLWVRGQFAASQVIDFCALMATNATTATQIRLRLGTSQAQVDGTAPYDSGNLPIIPSTGEAGVGDDEEVLIIDFLADTYEVSEPTVPEIVGAPHSFLEVSPQTTATWWRIDITGHTGDFEAAALVLGKKIEPSHYYDNTGHQFGHEDLGKLTLNRWGVPDEEPGVVLPTVEFTLSWQSEAEYEANWRALMREVGVRNVLYCCFDPAATDYRNGRTYLGYLRKAVPAVGVRKTKTYAMEFSLISIL